MSRIQLPQSAKEKSTAPNWVNGDELVQASSEEAKRNQETLSKITSDAQVVVLSFFNPNTNAVFAADDPRLLAQVRLHEKKGSVEGVTFMDPDTNEPLVAYKTAKRVQSSDKIRHSGLELKPEKGGTYTNTTLDRHIAYKALEEMQRFASSKGMSIPRARYIKSAYGSKQKGSNLITINNIMTELEWYYGKNQKGRAFATISVDPAGKFIHPKTFKIASGEDFEFCKESIEMLEKDARFAEMISEIKPKKTDIPTFKRPDPSRFMATASMKKTADMMGQAPGMNPPMGQAVAPTAPKTPQAPGDYQPGGQYTNPADGVTYTMKSYDPNTGAVVTSPEGQDMQVPANEVPNLNPLVPTQAKKNAMDFSVEAMAEVLMKKHSNEVEPEATEAVDSTDTDDEVVANALASKKEAGEKGNCSKCGKPNFICRGKCEDGVTDEDGNERLKDEDTEENDDTDKEASMPILKTASKKPHFSHVPNMSKRWNEIRKEIGDERPFASAPEKAVSKEQSDLRLKSEGYKASTEKNEPNEMGRDTKTHIPSRMKGDAEIGMTEYPEFDQNFQEAQAEMVERREHFQNEHKLPIDNMKRDELGDYADGKKEYDNYGLSETSREEEFENPEMQFEASLTNMAEELISKKATEVGPEGQEPSSVQERPIVHKDIKRAPGLPDYKEPEVIEEVSGKVKEGITKLRKVQADIKDVKAELQKAIAPMQKKLQETQKPFNEDLIKKQESLSSYLEMIYSQLSDTEDKIGAYSDKIFAVIERSKDQTKSVSMAQLLAKLEATDQALFEAVTKVKEAMEDETVVAVLERFLYEYPVSQQHEQKKVVRKSADEVGAFSQAITVLKDALMGLFNVSDIFNDDVELEENLEVA